MAVEKIASWVGVIGAAAAVWARLVTLEARADSTEKVMMELTSQLRTNGDEIRLLQLQSVYYHGLSPHAPQIP